MATVHEQLLEHSNVFEALAEQTTLIERVAQALIQVLEKGNKIFLAGNGGSAADAQHIAAELSGRYLRERSGLAAIALTTDTSALTAIGNDFGFDQVFSRQLQALAQKGDAVIAYSTSGNSQNILNLLEQAKLIDCFSVGLTGESGGKMKAMLDECFCVPSGHTPRIQEAHAFIGHALCDIIDQHFSS